MSKVKKRFLYAHVVPIKDSKDIILSGEEAAKEIMPEVLHLINFKPEECGEEGIVD